MNSEERVSTDRLTVLYVEDSETDWTWFEKNMGQYLEVIRAKTIAECHRSGECDVALLDLNLEDSIGVDTVRKFRAGLPHVPVVVLSHVDDPRVEAMCMEAGCHAYYRKGTFDIRSLVRSMEAAVVAFRRKAQHAEELTVHGHTLDDILGLITRIKERMADLTKRGDRWAPFDEHEHDP